MNASERTVLLATTSCLCMGLGLLLVTGFATTAADQVAATNATTASAPPPATAAAAVTAPRTRANRAVTVVAAMDGRPIADALVLGGPAGQQVWQLTDTGGIAPLLGSLSSSDELTISAPGFESWTGSLPHVEPPVVALNGRAGFVLRASTGAFPAGASAVARPVRDHGALAEAAAAGVLRGDGTVAIEGLSPRGLYQLEVDARGHSVFLPGPVPAGWPQPTAIEVGLTATECRGIEVVGVDAAACAHLEVALVIGGRSPAAARLQWDAERRTGVATPSSNGGDRGELVVRGPLGVPLRRQPWARNDGASHRVQLELQHRTVALVVASGAGAPAADCIGWTTGDASGFLGAPASSQLELFWSADTGRHEVDLAWGKLVAPAVRVPREEPIVFLPGADGELRVIDASAGRVEAIAEDGGARCSLGTATGATLATRLPAGRYVLNVDDEPVGPEVQVHAGQVTVVSLAQMRERAGLVIVLPEVTAAAGAEGIASVAMATHAERSLRSVAFALRDRRIAVADLPPGEVLVQVQAKGTGYGRGRGVLVAGQSATVVIDEWCRERTLTVEIRDAAGAPRAGVELELNLDPAGQAPIARGVTDGAGQYRWPLAGHGTLTVGTRHGMWVVAIDPEQQSLTLVEERDAARSLRVTCSGWWAGKVRGVGALIARRGVEFVPGALVGDSYVMPTADKRVVVVRLADKGMVFVAVPAGATELVLSEPMAANNVLVQCPEAAPGELPTVLEPRLLEVDGMPVAGTVLATALRRSVLYGQPIVVAHGAPLRIAVDGVGSHGGIVWRSEAIDVVPGPGSRTATLQRLTR